MLPCPPSPIPRCPTCGRPKLLDRFCGAGGASVGFDRAGFCVTGIDVVFFRRYPFRFVQADALEYGAEHGHEYAAHAASPPCKVYTDLSPFASAAHLGLVEETREELERHGAPWIIENVPGAPLRAPVTLCGSSFDLGVERHRLFESNVTLTAPPCDHARQAELSPGYPVKRYHSGRPVITMSPVVGVYGRGQGLGKGEVDLWRRAMGIDWMARDELSQAIPPAYTEHLGAQLLAHLAARSPLPTVRAR